MIIYWQNSVFLMGIFCDDPLLEEYTGFFADTNFITDSTENEMTRRLDQGQYAKDRKTRNQWNSMSSRKAAVFLDFIEVFGREARTGDPTKACVNVFAPS